jgi:hypothetical protein
MLRFGNSPARLEINFVLVVTTSPPPKERSNHIPLGWHLPNPPVPPTMRPGGSQLAFATRVERAAIYIGTQPSGRREREGARVCCVSEIAETRLLQSVTAVSSIEGLTMTGKVEASVCLCSDGITRELFLSF